ncbi:MAG: trehalose 2-sulfotransferase [Acidimicrobiaceae bacterium]
MRDVLIPGIPLPHGGRPQRSYFICTTPRTGSWFLCHALANTGVAGMPSEYFFPGAVRAWRRTLELAEDASYREYVDAVVDASTTSNGIFGAKLMWQYAPALIAEVPDLDAAFPALQYIHLERADRAAQAVSFWRATVTGSWADSYGDATVPPYDFDAILRHHTTIVDGHAAWREWLAQRGADVLELEYEDIVVDHERAVRTVLQHIGVPDDDVAMPKPALVRQADGVSADYRDRFVADLRSSA